MATEHGQVVVINCHVLHRKSVKEYVAQKRMEYVRALERQPVIVVGDSKYDPRRSGAETEVDREVRLLVEEMRLQDGFHNEAAGPSHYPAPEGSTPSRINAMFADPWWVWGGTAGYMVGPEEMRDRKGHCPMMVTVHVKAGEQGKEEAKEQDLEEEGVSLPPPMWRPEEGDDDTWQQWVQQVHVEMRRGGHAHGAMRKAANVCGFSRPVGETQTQPKVQQLVAKPRKRQQEEVGVRKTTEDADRKEEVARAKKRVQAARRAVEDVHGRMYQKVVAEHERYMERAVPSYSLRYIRELTEAGQ